MESSEQPASGEPFQSPSALSPAEEQLLAFIREGRFDAEIAVRLGVGAGDVKDRIERLRVKLGAQDRQGIRDGGFRAGPIESDDLASSPDEAVSPRINLPRLLVTGLACCVVLGICAFVAVHRSPNGDRESIVVERSDGQPLIERSSGPFDMDAFRTAVNDGPLVRSVDPTPTAAAAPLVRSGNADLGKMFDTYPGGTLQIQSDAGVDGSAVLTFSSDGSILLDGGGLQWTLVEASSATATLNCVVSGVDTSLVVTAQGASRLLPTAAGVIGVYSVDSSLPRITIVAASTVSGAIYPVSVDTRGHLFINATPLP